jgi:hypothetical protein
MPAMPDADDISIITFGIFTGMSTNIILQLEKHYEIIGEETSGASGLL